MDVPPTSRYCTIARTHGTAQCNHPRIMEGLASEAAEPKTIMIDATYLKAHRTASSLRVKKGGAEGPSGAQKAA